MRKLHLWPEAISPSMYLARSLGKSIPLSLSTSLSMNIVLESGSCLLISAVTRSMRPCNPSVLRPAIVLYSGSLT